MRFSARALNKKFFDVDIVVINKIEMWFIVVCTLINNEHSSLLFSNIFSHCFCMLSEFAKVFDRKVRRVQVAHFRNVARALSSPNTVGKILIKNSFVIFDTVVENKSNVV